MDNAGFCESLTPILSLTTYAELDSGRAERYWNYLRNSKREQIHQLREHSKWVICWLKEYVPGGSDIASGFSAGICCERGYVTLLDSFTTPVLTQLLIHAFATRQQPGFPFSARLEEFLCNLLSLEGQEYSASHLWEFVRELTVGETVSLLSMCKAAETTLHNAKALIDFTTDLEQHQVAMMLIELTAWGNTPPTKSSWWSKFSAGSIVERLTEGQVQPELRSF